MTAAAMSLLATLERQKARGLAAEHRLRRDRNTLSGALTALRTGEDPGIVLARLRARGLRVETGEGEEGA